MPVITEVDGGVVVAFKVVTRAAKDRLSGLLGDHLKLHITAPPVDGKANDRIVRFLAEEFGVPRSSVRILRGGTSNKKMIFLPVNAAAVEARLKKKDG